HLSFLSVLSRHAPLSPPFPYTTLFRSYHGRPACGTSQAGRIQRGGQSGDGGFHIRESAPVRTIRRLHALSPAFRRRRPALPRGGDRKSTRLNSSHVKISYAVFCLKKKK